MIDSEASMRGSLTRMSDVGISEAGKTDQELSDKKMTDGEKPQ